MRSSFHRPIQARAESLTIIRFFAALMVFCDHYAAELLKSAPAMVRNLLDRGSAGVQMFFILSGFLMVIVYGSRPGVIAKREFYVNRIARIYPAYLLALIVSLQMAYSWIKSVGIAPGLNTPLYVLSKLTMTDGWYVGRYEAKTAFNWMQQGWSLSSEVFFYALFPLLLPVVLRLSWKQGAGLAILGLALCQAFTRLLMAYVPIDAGFAPPVQLPVFLIGMGMGRVALEHGPKLAEYRSARIVTVLVAILYQALTPESQLPDWQFTGLQICYALLIGSLGLEFYQSSTAAIGPFKKVFIILGEASYSLYLLQAAVVAWLTLVFAKLKLREADSPESWGFFLLAFAVANLAAWLVWRTFEGPARKWVQKKFAK